MSKRQKFVSSAIFLSGVFLLTASNESINRFLAIGIITILSIGLFYWSLAENLRKDATLLVLLLPALFTFGVGSFWFLLPTVALARLPVVILYGVGLYALALTSNIYTVSTLKTIALLRAAKSVGFVITLLTSFLLFDAIFSFKAQAVVTVSLVFLTSLLLMIPSLWSSNLGRTLSKKVVYHSLTYSYIISLFSASLFFWPTIEVVSAIFLTITLYVLLGLGQAQIEERLYSSVVREYLAVAAIVIVAMILFTSYRG